MIAQVEMLVKVKEKPQRFSVVFMGMGEPFDNYDNVLRAIRTLQ